MSVKGKSEPKITDLRVAHIDGVPKHCILLKLCTDAGIVGYGEVRDAASATYALMLKSRLLGENPLNVEKLTARIKQFGGHSRQGGGVSGIEIALWDIVGKYYGRAAVPAAGRPVPRQGAHLLRHRRGRTAHRPRHGAGAEKAHAGGLYFSQNGSGHRAAVRRAGVPWARRRACWTTSAAIR